MIARRGSFWYINAMHREEGLSFRITDKITDIPSQDWDRLFGKELIECYGYHRTLQESGLKGFSFYYLLARRNDAIMAIIPFFTTVFSFSTTIQGGLQRLILGVQKIFPEFLKTPILFVGNPTCEELYLGVCETEDQEALLKGAMDTLYSFCRNKKIGTMLFYNLTRRHSWLMRSLSRAGFRKMESFPNTEIEIKAASLQDFISSLGKNTRKGIRRKLRDSRECATLRTEVRSDISGIENRIYELYLNNLTEGDVYFEILTPEFFRDICRNSEGTARFFVTYAGDKIVAFNLLLIKGGRAIDKFVGFDREVSHKYNLYYATFAHNIDYCIKNGLCFYQMGITDYEPKVRLGSKLIPLYIYARFINPLLNLFTGIVIKLIEPKRFDPVLKRTAYAGDEPRL